MAVKADNLNKLISRNDPYVHSNIANFRAIHNQSLLKATNGTNRFNQTLEKIKTVRDNLKNQTQAFLGGYTVEDINKSLNEGKTINSKSTKQFIKQNYFNDKDGQKRKKYFEAFIEFFSSPYFYSNINQKMGYSIQEINEVFGINIEGTGLLSEGYMIKAITDAFITQKNSKTKGKIDFDLNFDIKKMTKIAKSLFLKKKINPTVTSIKRDIKNILRDKTKVKQGGQIELATVTKKLVESNYCTSFISQKLGKEYNEEEFYFYRDTITSSLSFYLNNKMITQQSELSGPMGEEYFVSILQGTGEKEFGDIMLTGTWDEKKIQKELTNYLKKIQGENYEPPKIIDNPWQPTEGVSSYSDFIIKHPKTGQIARVQSKHYEEILLKFKENEQNMIQHINLFKSKRSILDFIDKLQNTGQVFSEINPRAISYVIANALWFSYAGSINRDNIISKQEISTADIFSEIGAGVGNFLGIIVDKSLQPIQEFTNMFFLVNNRILLPTWVILDELYNMIKKHPIRKSISTLSMTKGTDGYAGWLSGDSINTSAFEFKKQKKEALNGESFNYFKGTNGQTANYSNQKLLNVGKAKGKAIIRGTDKAAPMMMRNINLNIDYERAIKSAYNLFG